MATTTPINLPARYASAFAVGHADASGNLNLVSEGQPLPVRVIDGSIGSGSGTSPNVLAGQTTTDTVAGPFQPALGVPITVTLAGTWTGTVKVMRSTDNGATLMPLTVAGAPWGEFQANANEQVWSEAEAAARFYLTIDLTSGSLSYRVAQ